MSSLTSLGVNKNKKGFAPKLSKRKDRKERKPAPPRNTADVSLSTEAPEASAFTLAEKVSTAPSIEKAAQHVSAIATELSSSTVKIQSTPVTVLSAEEEPTTVDPKNESLTEEETALNAVAASRNRRRRSLEEPSSPSSNHPRVEKETSPIHSPSPMAHGDQLDCNIERNRSGATFLKVERMTPDTKKRLGGITEGSQHSTIDDTPAEDLIRIRKESVAPKLDNIVPKIDLDDDNMDYTSLLASGENDDVDVDGDVYVEKLMPENIDAGNPQEKSSPATKRILPRLSKSSASVRLKATRYNAEDDSDDFEEGEEEEEEEEEQTKPAPKKRKIIALKPKGKGKEKEKEKEKGKGKPSAKKKSTARIKDSKKGGATAISIGIGVPTSSSSSSSAACVPSASVDAEEEEEEYSDKDSDGKRIVKTRKKPKGQKKQYKYAYRLVENMRTLDDITNDPAVADNLDKPMSNFTKDIDGIVSKVYKEMEIQRSKGKKKEEERSNLSKEELEALKKKEAEEERIAKEKKDTAKAKDEERRRKELDGQVLAESSNALQVRLVNGQIVLDTDSLVVERTEGDTNYGDDPMEIVEESSLTKKVNSATYGKRKPSARWDELETASFYDCLSQFGTDFEMIAAIMPGRNRNQIRTKFNREERLCPEKVTEYMITKRKLMDLQKYTELAGIELEAVPDDFHEMQLA